MALPSSLIAALGVLWLGATWRGCHRSMPPGLAVASPLLPVSDLAFFTDLTFRRGPTSCCYQEILPAALTLIAEAQSFLILDIFLYNDLQARNERFPRLCQRLTRALLAAKKNRPDLAIWLISDPINTGYGSYANPYFQQLRQAGIRVVLTNLEALPDSNIVYAGFWNLLGRFWPQRGHGRLPSAFYREAPPFTVAGWLALLGFKANHRKVVVSEKQGLITSANPSHDASSANSNIAFTFSGPLLAELVKSEAAVVAAAGQELDVSLPPPPSGSPAAQGQLLSEGKIKEALLADLNGCQAPATLWLAMFYLADRQIIAALLAAARRGVAIRIILDANRDAFGHKKSGVPNRPVAAMLHQQSAGRIQIRWSASHGEQFHTKLLLLQRPDDCIIMAGSANLTRRNIGNYNLETCLRLVSAPAGPVCRQVDAYFHRLWHNDDGHFTLGYEQEADHRIWKYWQYRLQEATGLSLF